MSEVLFSYVIPTIHVLSCLFLVVVVLLQTGKGADMGAVFGGGSQTLFGSGGAGNFLTRLTTATAIVFMLTSLVLTYGQAPTTRSGILDRLPPPAAPDAGEQPAPGADAGAPGDAPVAAVPGEAPPPGAGTPPASDAAPAETPPAPPPTTP